MMGEAGGHYCSKKTDDLCGDVCGQVEYTSSSETTIYSVMTLPNTQATQAKTRSRKRKSQQRRMVCCLPPNKCVWKGLEAQ
ncbi:hypothetical protein QN277_018417 [Acacia crassicarpa]|uniref:Uncharacterized protein n=1 Tax=Acacia crassicarpa TaxID=499986 RepID=A0AAE1JUG2_9FABA|nr:hypothetical protein QN277_018417 [Acacia crassicarpa]